MLYRYSSSGVDLHKQAVPKEDELIDNCEVAVVGYDAVDGCAGRPAEGRRCKSVTVKAQRATPTPSHARAVVRLQAKR